MIIGIELRNFMCYRGEHAIDLEARAYAIVARREDDPMRSNWSGKSALLEAIDFALFGRLNKARRFNADGWITRGEKQGHVEIVFDDGTFVRRERTRGSATKVTYKFPIDKACAGAEAEKMIAEKMQLSEDDFRASCYFEQRAMAKLILADPSERLGIVSGWLGLTPIETAEERAGEIASEHAKRAAELRSRRNALESVASQVNDVAQIEREIERLTEVMPSYARKIETLNEERVSARKKARAQSTIREYDVICRRGKEIGDELGDDTGDEVEREYKRASAAHTEAAVKVQELERETAAKRKVALGQFDGRCPVASIECPATKQINDDRKPARKALQDVEKRRDEARAVHEEAQRTYNGVRIVKSKHEQLSAEIERLRSRAREMIADVKEARALLEDDKVREETAIEIELDTVRIASGKSSARLEHCRSMLEQTTKLRAEIEQLDKRIEEASKQAQIATQGRKVFRATHRRVAETALARINEMTNDALVTSGIDLSVDVRWEREGTTAAKTCDECGAAFPASVKVKLCEQCGAPRGMNTVNKLEFVLSDRSGAADDIAGVTLQLSAGAWLLNTRQSQWRCALIDEPFGQLDAFHRRALARHLATMLTGRYGYGQALVIAHDTTVLDALPGRIEVIAGKDGSRLKVIA